MCSSDLIHHLAPQGSMALLLANGSMSSNTNNEGEIRKRHGVLKVLYTHRLMNPSAPALRGRDFVELLGCPVEHLEFALWFLRESKFITRSDNNRFEITRLGVEAFEAEEANYGKKQYLKLPAASGVID